MRGLRQRIGEFDVVEWLGGRFPAPLIQIGFGLACSVVAIWVRLLIDTVAPSAGPFALLYPAILIATLYGRWPAGLVTFATSFLYAWYVVLPPAFTFQFAQPSDATRTLVNALASLVVLAFAEVFRFAVRRTVTELNREVSHRELLLRELDHRTKNNFQIVASLLDLQLRRQTSEEARDALGAAVARVHSFAAAHESLYASGSDLTDVSMSVYLENLANEVVAAAFAPERITLATEVQDVMMPREKAISIGVVLNEAVTNAAKHAFGPEGAGTITVSFAAEGEDWRLVVRDDGAGAAKPAKSSGLGSSLIESFAARAGAKVATERLPRGTEVRLTAG